MRLPFKNIIKRRKFLVWIATAVTSMALVLGLQFANLHPAQSQSTTTLNVYAAVSLTNALNQIRTQFQTANPGVTVNYTFGASGTLYNQIIAGAPADIFISAATEQVDALQSQGRVRSGSRRNIARNRLALIIPTTAPVSPGSTGLQTTGINGLTNSNVTGVAIGDPTGNPPVVPAGTYAVRTLNNRGIYNAVQPKLRSAANVRAVLTAVENKTLTVNGVPQVIDAGFVYTTDAAISQRVRVVDTATVTDTGGDIVYPLVILSRTPSTVLPTAQAFSNYLTNPSGQAQGTLRNFGFRAP